MEYITHCLDWGDDMIGVRLEFADGTAIQDGRAGLSDGFLWLNIPDKTMQEVAEIVLNKAATSTITFYYGEMEDVFTGYTSCVSILLEGENVSACMVQEESA